MSLTSRRDQNPADFADKNQKREALVPAPSKQETARYIAALSAELSVMARQADLELLGYFLEMARMEASAAASGKRVRRKADLRALPSGEDDS
jgi:hypothetical protein